MVVRKRFVLAAVAVLVLAGCGSAHSSGIKSVDRPVSAQLARALRSSGSAACVDVTGSTMAECHGPQSAVSRDRPRLLAALPLSWQGLSGYEGLFVLFWTGRGSACFDVQVARRDGTGAGPLKCLGNPSCGAVCLTAIPKDGRWLLGGTVAAEARRIRLIYPGAKTLRYTLDGPTAAALAGGRILMVDLGGRGAPRREELVR